MVQRFRILPIESYIITKIDETEEYVPILNQLLRFKRPLSYLTNGSGFRKILNWRPRAGRQPDFESNPVELTERIFMDQPKDYVS